VAWRGAPRAGSAHSRQQLFGSHRFALGLLDSSRRTTRMRRGDSLLQAVPHEQRTSGIQTMEAVGSGRALPRRGRGPAWGRQCRIRESPGRAGPFLPKAAPLESAKCLGQTLGLDHRQTADCGGALLSRLGGSHPQRLCHLRCAAIRGDWSRGELVVSKRPPTVICDRVHPGAIVERAVV